MSREKTKIALKRVEHDLIFWQGKANQIQRWIENPPDDRNNGTDFYPSWLANVQQRIIDAQAEQERLQALLRG